MLKLRILERFRRAQEGLAALEFALILPLLITMLFGMGELSLAIFCRTDVSQMASTSADLVAQKSVPTTDDITSVYAAANTLLYPFYDAASKPSVRITSVVYDSTAKVGKVAWSCIQAGNASFDSAGPAAALAKGSPVTDYPDLLTDGSSVVMAEVAYNYTSPTLKVLTGAIKMSAKFATKPRQVAVVPAPACPK